MSEKDRVEIDFDSLKTSVDDLLRRIREDEDPAELNLYRKMFKKAVPLFLRSYVAAYLLRNLAVKGTGRRKMTTTTLFVSIGKNRRVFPRDLVQLLSSAGKIPKSDIGDIKILDNYSFVEVDEKVVGAVIGRMDGITYRGRRLTVNFAKKRSPEDSGSSHQDAFDELDDHAIGASASDDQ